ncbi:MAG: dihydroneopterin aldolase [Bacteroidota bacterium]
MKEAGSVTVKVEDLEVYIGKGLYDAERKVENHFKVSAELCYQRSAIGENEFVNYESIAEIIAGQMHSDEKLLENIAFKSLQAMKEKWPFATTCKIIIRKLHPAFTNQVIGAVVVEVSI